MVNRPTRLSPFYRRLSPADRDRASPGFFAPSTHALRVPPLLPRPARTPTVGGEGRQALTGAAPGLSQPLGGLSHAAPLDPGCPVSARDDACPVTPRPCFMPQTSLGFALQSLPLPESRTASSAARASLRVRPRSCPGAAPHARREAFRCALVLEPRRGHEAHDRDRQNGTQLPALTEAAEHDASCPAPGLDDRTRHRTRRPHGRTARFEALLPPRVRSRGARSSCRSLRPDPPERTPGRCSPGIQPFWSLLHRVLGSGRSRRSPANRTPPEDHAPLR